MRILHVISDLDPAGGGPPLVASRLAAAQAALGHRAGLVCYAGPDARERIARDLAALPGADRIELEALRPGGRAERLRAGAGRRVLGRLVGSADIVHLHGVWDPLLRAAAITARRARKPYVVAPHGMLDAWALSEKRLKKRAALALGYRAMIRGAAFLQALSAYERDCLVAGGFNASVRVIPNGVFLEELRPLPDPDAFHRLHPGLAPGRYLLFLARLHPVKGLDLLAEAFALVAAGHPGAHVVVAGPDFGARTSLEAQVARLGIGDRFRLVGPVYGADKLTALAGALALVLPSKHEGFSMSIAEALGCAVPVVITRECHFPEVGEVGAGVVVERTVAALASGLERVLCDPGAARAMGAAGLELIRAKYTWPAVAERCVNEYGMTAGTGP